MFVVTLMQSSSSSTPLVFEANTVPDVHGVFKVLFLSGFRLQHPHLHIFGKYKMQK